MSMGATSARKAAAIVSNSEFVVAVEALSAAQGLDLRGLSPAPGTAAARDAVRSLSPMLEEDRSLSEDITAIKGMISAGALLRSVEGVVGALE